MNDLRDERQAQEEDDRGERRRSEPADPGLCGRCAHVQIVTSARGSRFFLCTLSFTDPAFPRYPAIPVIACPGFVTAGGG